MQKFVNYGEKSLITLVLVSKPTIELCSGDPLTNSTSSISSTLNVTDVASDAVDIRCEMKVTMGITFLSGIIQVTNWLAYNNMGSYI